MSADAGILGIVEVVLEDEGLDLVGETGVVILLGRPTWAVPPIRELGDLVVDDGAVGGASQGCAVGIGGCPSVSNGSSVENQSAGASRPAT